MYYSSLLLLAYVLVWVISGIFSFPVKGSKNTNIFLISSFLLLFLVHSFKEYGSFPDLTAYVYGFKEVDSRTWMYLVNNDIYTFKCERGFAVFMKAVSLVSKDNVFFLATVSSLILAGYFVTIKKYSNIVWLSVIFLLLGPYCRSLFVIRQHLAVAVCMASVYFIIRRKLIPYLILVAIAFSFHKTAIVFLPLYFLYGIDKGSHLKYLFLTGFLVLISTFRLVVYFMAEEIGGYSSYTDEGGEMHFNYIILSLSLLIVRLIVMGKSFFKGDIDKLLSIVLCIVSLMSIVGASFESTGRILLYYTGLSCLYFPNTFAKIKDKILRNTITAGYLLLLTFIYITGLDYFEISRTTW